MRGGIRVYTEEQGCDIVGNGPDGRALYVEVKGIEKKNLNFGPNGHVKSHQREFLLARSKEKCLAMVAWYYQEKFYFIRINQIVLWMEANGKTSYPIGEAMRFNMLP